jgi:hypothetical protein
LKPQSHEDLGRDHAVTVGSERSFGLVFAVFFMLVGAVRAWHQLTPAFWAWMALGLVFAVIAWAAPSILKPLNVLWFRFGLFLHRILSPLMLGLMFFFVFTPLGWCMRALGKRPLDLDYAPGRKSYWIHRTPPGPASSSFDRQF